MIFLSQKIQLLTIKIDYIKSILTGATFLINYLSPNTSYFMRAASKNLAGLSDWTTAEIFTTKPKDEPTFPTDKSTMAKASLVGILLSLLISF